MTYPVSDNFVVNTNCFNIPIRHILLSDTLINTLRSLSPNLDLSGLLLSRHSDYYPLHYEPIQPFSLYPIRVSRVSYHNKTYYTILDGRHRVILSILRGYSQIPAVFV